jgi:hypothetical protein
MIANLIVSGERIQDNASLKDDHGLSECQEFQLLIRVFGTDRRLSRPYPEQDAELRLTCCAVASREPQKVFQTTQAISSYHQPQWPEDIVQRKEQEG